MNNQVTVEDRAEMYQLALEYARAADRRDYPAFAAITTPDAIIAGHNGDPKQVEALYTMRGHEQITKAMAGLERYDRTLHVVSNQQVEVHGDEGSGETYCVAHHLYDKAGATYDHTMYIRYQDRYRRVAGKWLFAERRLWVDFTSDRPLEVG